MNELSEKVSRLVSGKPIGELSEVGNNYYKDEAGRIYEVRGLEEVKRRKEYAKFKRDKRHFTFTHMLHVREITENLSNKYCGYLMMLQPYIQFETNILVTKGRNPKPLDVKEIAEIIGVQPRSARSTLKKFEEMEIVKKLDDGCYKMNERYHFRKKAGVDVDMLVKTFHTAVKELKLKPAELGVLYKLLPYVHYESNLICENPLEDKDVKLLNKTEIAKKVGMSRQKLDKALKNLLSAGVIAEIERKSPIVPQAIGDEREKVILINPNIITRITGEPNTTIKQIFEM